MDVAATLSEVYCAVPSFSRDVASLVAEFAVSRLAKWRDINGGSPCLCAKESSDWCDCKWEYLWTNHMCLISDQPLLEGSQVQREFARFALRLQTNVAADKRWSVALGLISKAGFERLWIGSDRCSHFFVVGGDIIEFEVNRIVGEGHHDVFELKSWVRYRKKKSNHVSYFYIPKGEDVRFAAGALVSVNAVNAAGGACATLTFVHPNSVHSLSKRKPNLTLLCGPARSQSNSDHTE